jgi:hypothetical protein
MVISSIYIDKAGMAKYQSLQKYCTTNSHFQHNIYLQNNSNKDCITPSAFQQKLAGIN